VACFCIVTQAEDSAVGHACTGQGALRSGRHQRRQQAATHRCCESATAHQSGLYGCRAPPWEEGTRAGTVRQREAGWLAPHTCAPAAQVAACVCVLVLCACSCEAKMRSRQRRQQACQPPAGALCWRKMRSSGLLAVRECASHDQQAWKPPAAAPRACRQGCARPAACKRRAAARAVTPRRLRPAMRLRCRCHTGGGTHRRDLGGALRRSGRTPGRGARQQQRRVSRERHGARAV
jgi:hypothetical protein